MTTIWIKQEFGKYWNIFGEDEKADYEVDSQTTTLLMDNDDLKVDEAQACFRLRYEVVSERLLADKFVLGVSETGIPGEYHVIKEIENLRV